MKHMKHVKKQKNAWLWILLALVLVLCAAALLIFVPKWTAGGSDQAEGLGTQTSSEASSDDMPKTYTWEEYQQLPAEEQEAFAEQFASEEDFEAWKEAENPTPSAHPTLSLDEIDKEPEDFTWEEYQGLSLEDKDAFYEKFASTEAFELWMETVRPTPEPHVTVDPEMFDKAPEEYSWEEYQAMTFEQQDAFFSLFDSAEAFEAWKDAANPMPTPSPKPSLNDNDKRPESYTWAEYQALTPEQQDVFFEKFDSTEAFEAWMASVKPTPTPSPKPSLNDNGKRPESYTWAEYQALTPEQQDVFFEKFGSTEAFEAWMASVKPTPAPSSKPTLNETGKKPEDYTWKEYQALSPEQQDVFFEQFSSAAAFEAWMESVKPTPTPSPQPSIQTEKDPEDYTWEEYQALSYEEQDAFFEAFGSVEAFEKWMNSVQPAPSASPAPNWEAADKKPEEFTWEEYQALSFEEQDAFFEAFESVEAFEAWMEAAKKG